MEPKLRALILAAGLGTRLRPLTLNTPKCLVDIGGKPLLKNWLEILEDINCEETLINTHYLAKNVDEFLKTYKPKKMTIKTIYEPNLLGTLGTLLAHKSWFRNNTGILIHGDNFTNANFISLLDAHKRKPKNCLLTMLTFKTSTPESCGIIEANEDGIMINFHEKIKNPPSNIANGAVYLFNDDFLDWLNEQEFKGNDFSNDVIPLLKGRIKTWFTKDHFIDIGTPQSLKKARSIFFREKNL